MARRQKGKNVEEAQEETVVSRERKPRGPIVSFEERQARRIAHHEALAKKQREELEGRAKARLDRQVDRVMMEIGKVGNIYDRLMGMPVEVLAAAARGFMELPLGDSEPRKVYALALLRAQMEWIEGQDDPSSPYGTVVENVPEPEPLRDVLVGG